jgi:hypothetical protein
MVLQYHMMFLQKKKEHTAFDVTSLSRTLLFENCSAVSIILIWQDLEHRTPLSKFVMAFCIGYLSYVGVHSADPLYYTV